MNICGALVHSHPKSLAAVEAALATLAGVEIHQKSNDGRLIITVEDTVASDGEPVDAGDQMLSLHRLPGVVSVALVYHHFEPDLAHPAEDSDDAVAA